ncbi:MAG: 4Fe-4S binding protein [Treponemataceae bacterium]|nr:4Fe-4S binding protein [Treponemataceae bacterium]
MKTPKTAHAPFSYLFAWWIRRVLAGAILLGAIMSCTISSPAFHYFLTVLSFLQVFPSVVRFFTFSLNLFWWFGLGWLLFLVAGTLLFGRWYCAFLCPLGTLQDVVFLIQPPKKKTYTAAIPLLRGLMLLGIFLLGTSGFMAVAGLFDPWSIFSRLNHYTVGIFISPYFTQETFPNGLVLISVSLVGIICILGLSFFSSRWFCGNICPVGTLLGFLNKHSLFHLVLNETRCIRCGRCTTVCRAACIDGHHKTLDPSRCIYCFACTSECPVNALYYGKDRIHMSTSHHSLGKTGQSAPLLTRSDFIRRSLGLCGLIGTALVLKKEIGGYSMPLFAEGFSVPIIPPGAQSIRHLSERCTTCGLCMEVCPVQIIKPSLGELGYVGMLMPHLDYGVSYCQYECTGCSEVCPTGAIQKTPVTEKKRIKIGDATLIRDRCIVIKNKSRCGACAEHCPTGAVHMMIGTTGLPEPFFTSTTCIGCGACHHVCPAEPKAITVRGLREHLLAEVPLLHHPQEDSVRHDLGSPAPSKAEDSEGFPF